MGESCGDCYLCSERTSLQCPYCGEWLCCDTHYQYHRDVDIIDAPLVTPGDKMMEDDGKCQPFKLKLKFGDKEC